MDAANLTEKYILWSNILDLRSRGINIARTARRLGVSRNTVRHLQSLKLWRKSSSTKNGITNSMPTSRPSHPSLPVFLHFQQPHWRLLAGTLSGLSARLREDRPQLCPVRPEEAPYSSGQIITGPILPRSGSPVRHIHNS